jgi:SAM-dependent methyltransferase
MAAASGIVTNSLRLYSDLARWWPLFSPPSHYVEEAADLIPVLLSATDRPPQTMLELGAGGGSLAYHLKHHLTLTLTDRSPEMLAVSQAVNPDCEHLPGDMTSLDLGREFDLVLVHDAIMYATDRDAALATIRTAYKHCRTGGAVILIPDHVRETFSPSTESGGEDAPDGRGLRYLQWVWDPDPADDTYEAAYAFLLRESDGHVIVEAELHRVGCFARGDWLKWLNEAGLDPRVRVDPWARDMFIGVKRNARSPQ